MAITTLGFDEIMSPLGEAAFRAEYLGKKPLHLKGDPDKWRALMSWDVLDRLLGMTTFGYQGGGAAESRGWRGGVGRDSRARERVEP